MEDAIRGEKINEKEKKPNTVVILVACLVVIFIIVGAGVIISNWFNSLSSEILPDYALDVTVLNTDLEEEYLTMTFIVNVKIKNTGNEELYVSYGDFHILTKDKRIISSTWTEDTIFLEELPAGTWTSGNVAFDYNLSEVSHEDLDKLVFEKEILFAEDIYFEWDVQSMYPFSG